MFRDLQDLQDQASPVLGVSRLKSLADARSHVMSDSDRAVLVRIFKLDGEEVAAVSAADFEELAQSVTVQALKKHLSRHLMQLHSCNLRQCIFTQLQLVHEGRLLKPGTNSWHPSRHCAVCCITVLQVESEILAFRSVSVPCGFSLLLSPWCGSKE